MLSCCWDSLFLCCLCVFAVIDNVTALRDHNGMYPLIPDYSEFYYYKNIRQKMLESMSINNCSIGGDVKYGTRSDDFPDLFVKVIRPPKLVVEKWGDINEGRLKQRIFAHVSENLCGSLRFKELVKGNYKRAKGCYKVYGPDKKTGKIVKRINDYGATLHPEHVRCDNQIAAGICNKGSNGIQMVDTKYRLFNQYPFVIHAQNVIVGRGGMFAMPCGPFGLFSSCEAVKCAVPEAAKTVPFVEQCRDSKQQCPYPRYDKVFVLTQYDDTQIGQFMQENFPKLIFHLEYLQQHPEVKIHFGFTKRDILPSYVLPHNFFAYFGLQDRLINGTVFANEIIMPREGGCQDIGYNIWEAMTMREIFFQLLGIEEDSNFKRAKPYKKTVLILTRSPGHFTQNKADANTRAWNYKEFPKMLKQIKQSFPNHDIEFFKDTNSTLMTCPLCQAEVFSRADIVIGHHGAGLSNAIFMKPGGVMIEVVYNFDSRHAPILGIFPRIADLVGLHHYSYYIKDVEFNGTKFILDVADFTNKCQLWAQG